MKGKKFKLFCNGEVPVNKCPLALTKHVKQHTLEEGCKMLAITVRLTYVAEGLVFSGVPLHEYSHSTHERCHSGPRSRHWDTRGLHTSWLHWEEWVVRSMEVEVVGTGQQLMDLP